jgi:predicted Zn-dependent protease
MLGQFSEAGQLLDQLLAAKPFDVSILIERGYLAMNAGKLEDGEQYLRRAYHLEPQSPSVNLALSGWFNLAGRPAEAKEYFDRGQALDEAHKEKQRLLKYQSKS